MILINDGFGIGVTNPQLVYKNIKARTIKLRKIIDDNRSSQERRDWAYKEFLGYQEELQEWNELVELPFDVLVVVQREDEKQTPKIPIH